MITLLFGLSRDAVASLFTSGFSETNGFFRIHDRKRYKRHLPGNHIDNIVTPEGVKIEKKLKSVFF